MEAEFIITKLRKTSFTFTTANKFRDKLKQMDEDERASTIGKLRIEKAKKENADIRKAIDEMLYNL